MEFSGPNRILFFFYPPGSCDIEVELFDQPEREGGKRSRNREREIEGVQFSLPTCGLHFTGGVFSVELHISGSPHERISSRLVVNRVMPCLGMNKERRRLSALSSFSQLIQLYMCIPSSSCAPG